MEENKMYLSLFIMGVELTLSTNLVRNYIRQRKDTQKAREFFDEVVRECDEELKNHKKGEN